MSDLQRKRRAKKDLPRRDELLQWLIDTPGGIDGGTLLDDARKRFHEILKTSSSPSTVEWLFNQLIGMPRTQIVQMIENSVVLEAVGRVTAKYLSGGTFDAWWTEVNDAIAQSPSDSTKPPQ